MISPTGDEKNMEEVERLIQVYKKANDELLKGEFTNNQTRHKETLLARKQAELNAEKQMFENFRQGSIVENHNPLLNNNRMAGLSKENSNVNFGFSNKSGFRESQDIRSPSMFQNGVRGSMFALRQSMAVVGKVASTMVPKQIKNAYSKAKDNFVKINKNTGPKGK